ncbi:RNA polymerase sigma factor [Mariniflexile rhizosphaerae]|uniref:RNA polymerase sigma-70 factor n=1 Tax=unclassified Mariniflexile TaxID=2643887 RepID=UPI000CA8C9A9|nr:RNA polymerase sigma-70 factor [Mariniflexile sp. TRM1-10]AXP80761.1 RNA polymerase sigma factor [Mariniflexile sp. TRM1-10]PLB19833.1 MAG: RNA polymerase ECF-type sigma factor [Flavobacteriaceae bacterium FS1-H7996/R]
MSHNSATGLKKVKIREQNVNFASKRKSLNHFFLKIVLVEIEKQIIDFNSTTLNTHSEPYQLTLKEYKKTFDSLYTLLCLFANKYLNDIEASKDIVQVVFIKIWEDNIEFRSEENIKSYLYTSVKNKSLDYIKSKRVTSTEKLSSIKIEDMETEPFYLREVVVLETHSIVEKAIKTLPKKCAQIIRLSINNFTNPEIATELGISINTVKAQKKIAYKKLKPILKDYLILIAFVFDLGD